MYPKVPLRILKKEFHSSTYDAIPHLSPLNYLPLQSIYTNGSVYKSKLSTMPDTESSPSTRRLKLAHVCPNDKNILRAELMAIQHTPSFLHPTLPTYIFTDILVSIYLLCSLKNSPSTHCHPHIVIYLRQSTPLLLYTLTWFTYTKTDPT